MQLRTSLLYQVGMHCKVANHHILPANLFNLISNFKNLRLGQESELLYDLECTV